MNHLLTALLFAVPLSPAGGTCNEACLWVKLLGSAGYACLSGSVGRSCVSTGNVCSIITSCRLTTILRPDGAILAIQRSCRRSPVPDNTTAADA